MFETDGDLLTGRVSRVSSPGVSVARVIAWPIVVAIVTSNSNHRVASKSATPRVGHLMTTPGP